MEPLLGRPGPVLQVCFPAARASVLEQLNRQREEGQLCDLSIQVQGQVFRAHRCVLAASSPYFHDQVLLKNVTTVSLPSVMDPLAFESVLNSAYTGQLSIVRDDIINYVTVASFLQMWHIVDKCTDILKRSRPLQASPGTASQQSPSSSDGCLAEPEEQRPPRAALPPLATWRRPTQSRWSRGALSFPLRVESECGSDTIPTPPLPCLAPAEADVPARPRIRVRLRGPPEDERRVEADEGVGELPDEDKVRVKCEEPQAGRLRESEAEAETEAESLWQSVSDWPLPEEDEGGAEGAANPLRPPASPSPCSPLSATPKVHFCHCGKAYTLKSMRDRHVKMTHLNLRPFACPVCSKTFKMKHHLTKHVKTHGGLRPYECALCGKKIVWRDSFLKHQARCQRGPAAPEDVKQEWDEPALPEDEGQT